MTRVAAVVLAVVGGVAVVSAQTPADQSAPAFEVASVKRSPPDNGGFRIGIWGSAQPGGRWTSRNATLEKIIRSAYPDHPLPDQLVGGPDWMRSTLFDISAKAPSATATADELRAMARNLLAERFKLRLHTKVQELPGYALVLARSDGRLGPSLRAAAIDCAAITEARSRGETIPPASARGCRVMVTDSGPITRLEAGGLALSRLANVLAPRVVGPVVDDTRLVGLFDITLEFATDLAAARASDTPSVFTAVQEQLGLRLESRRVPAEVLVIDSVEMPTPD